MNVIMYKDNVKVMEEPQESIREQIEQWLVDTYAFSPDLQECTDDDKFEIYLHSDSYDWLNSIQQNMLDNLGITEDPDEATESIKELFNLDFKLVDEGF